MKRLKFYFFFYPLVLLQLSLPLFSRASTQTVDKKLPPTNVLARGAATPTELAKSLLLAVQENNFDGINAFVLEDKEIVLLKNKGSEDMKAFLENTTATDLQNNLHQNYQELINQGINRTINWSEYEVSEARLGKGATKNTFLQPLTVVLAGKQHQPVELLLETVKLNNRYYLFRQVELKPQKKI